VLRCVAACSSVCCSVFCVTVFYSDVYHEDAQASKGKGDLFTGGVCCSVLQCVAVCCGV